MSKQNTYTHFKKRIKKNKSPNPLQLGWSCDSELLKSLMYHQRELFQCLLNQIQGSKSGGLFLCKPEDTLSYA